MGGQLSKDTTTKVLSAAYNSSYTGSRPDLLRLLPESCRNVLDVGCCTGAFGTAVKQRQEAAVVGVEIDSIAAIEARQNLDHVIVGSVEHDRVLSELAEFKFDAVILGDVLEHLIDPWRFLEYLRTECTADQAVFVISLPNVAHWSTLYAVWLRGTWPRRARGIHDQTHLRWFTPKDVRTMIQTADMNLTYMGYHRRLLEHPDKLNNSWWARILCLIIGPLSIFQILITCVKKGNLSVAGEIEKSS